MSRKKGTRRPAKSGGGGSGKAPASPQGDQPPALTLLRIEPVPGNAVHMVFEDEEAERLWRLESTSVHELLALLLGGAMRKGRRVVISKAGPSLEPSEKDKGSPLLCMSLGLVILCVEMDHAELTALSKEIEHALNP